LSLTIRVGLQRRAIRMSSSRAIRPQPIKLSNLLFFLSVFLNLTDSHSDRGIRTGQITPTIIMSDGTGSRDP